MPSWPAVARSPEFFEPGGRQRILAPGRNCWQTASASKAAVLVDASNYYAQLDGALRQASRSILILGWDFDGRIKLCPDRGDCSELGPFLRELVEARPELEIHILVWSVAVVHAPSAPMPLLMGAPWQEHSRIRVKLDRHHPFYAAHHQKVVCIDDTLAFVGGIDLTVRRWDTCGHSETNRCRTDPAGASYHPVHDVQMVVDGAAAHCLADLARARWLRAGGEAIAPVRARSNLWPAGLEPDFVDVPVAIARTAPAFDKERAIQEVMALTADMLCSARRWIYIETQYFTARFLGDLIERSLALPNGPEIVVVLTCSSSGILERFVMGKNRDRLVRRLRRADRYDRLRAFYAVVPGKSGPCKIHMHAKVLIVDDAMLRIGSSNLNNRSAGLDTECDLAIEAGGDAARGSIARIRERLLAEHLGVAPGAVREALREQGSLIGAIGRLNCNPRGLRSLPDPNIRGPTRTIFGTWLLDPQRPFAPRWLRRRQPDRQRRSLWSTLRPSGKRSPQKKAAIERT